MAMLLRNPRLKPRQGARLNPKHWAGKPALFLPFNEGGGGAHDISGNGNNGTLTGGVTWQPSVGGMGLTFDGSTGYVSLGLPAAINLPGALSVCVGIIPTSTAGIQVVYGDSNSQFVLRLSPTNLQIVWNSSLILTSTASLTLGKFYRIIATRSGSAGNWTGSIYINGKLDKSAGATTNPGSASNYSLGQRGTQGVQFFSGTIAEASIYPFAMTPAQVLALYQRPYDMLLQRPPRRGFFGPASGSPLILPAGTATVTAQAASPAVALGPVSPAPGAVIVSVEADAPAISLGVVTAAAGVANVTLQLAAPPIVLGAISRQPGVAVVTLDVAAPSVSGVTRVAAGVCDVAAALAAPAVTLGPVSLACGMVELSAAAIVPTVVLGPVSLQPGAAQVSMTIVAPATTEIDVTAGVGTMTIDASGPAVTFPAASPTIEIWRVGERPTIWIA